MQTTSQKSQVLIRTLILDLFDFFSMVELIKLESEIKFAPPDKDIDSKLVIESEQDSIDSGVQAIPEQEQEAPLIPKSTGTK